MTASAQVSTDMDQVHTPTEGRKTQGQHQHEFPQTWIKFTHLLRGGENPRTASAQISTGMDQVHTPTEGRKTQGQHQPQFPQAWIKFTHSLRAGQHKDSISTSFHRHGSSSHTN